MSNVHLTKLPLELFLPNIFKMILPLLEQLLRKRTQAVLGVKALTNCPKVSII
jgi:hypothetical protein